jgi:hypothetical protein
MMRVFNWQFYQDKEEIYTYANVACYLATRTKHVAALGGTSRRHRRRAAPYKLHV